MSNLGNKKVFAKNLVHYMEARGKERTDICADLGFKYTTFVDWENAKTYPRIDKIEMLANYFGIQKSDLIEDKQKPAVQDDELNKRLALFNSLSQEKQRQVLEYMRFLASQEENL